jgi:hypothetical protein
MQKLLILTFILFIATTSCRTLPKITPFVEASSEMRKSMNAGFVAINNSITVDELNEVISVNKGVERTKLKNLRDLENETIKLRQTADVANKSMAGIIAYAGALNSLVESGNSGEKDALQVTNALTDILSQIVPKPVSSIVGITENGIAKINEQIARVRASKKLKEIMDETSPILSDYNTVFLRMLDTLKDYNNSVYLFKKQILATPFSLNTSVRDYNKALDLDYITTFREIVLLSDYRNTKDLGTLDSLRKIDKLVSEDGSNVEARQTTLIARSKEIETEKMRIFSMIEKIKTLQKRYNEEFNLTNQLFDKSKKAIAVWISTNADIRKQLDKKSLPNFAELNEIADELKDIREKIKNLSLKN